MCVDHGYNEFTVIFLNNNFFYSNLHRLRTQIIQACILVAKLSPFGTYLSLLCHIILTNAKIWNKEKHLTCEYDIRVFHNKEI